MKLLQVDEGHAVLTQLIGYYGVLQLADANEAETRKKVIDTILEKVLGWNPNDDISYETRVSENGATEFADYLIKTASTAIVVEAKRVGQAFALPNNKKTGHLGGFLSEGTIGEAIAQVRDYSRKLSIPFAVVTNGSSWVVFPAVRIDGVTFEKSYAIIFRDLQDVKDRFVEFWELLSRQRVIEGSLETKFFEQGKSASKRRLLSLNRESGYRLGRNRVYEYIEQAVSTALTDEAILENEGALEFCYVKSSERIKYDSRLKMYLADIKPPLERKVIRTRQKKVGKHLDRQIEISAVKPPQFLLVLGSVGAGKTTFLKYTEKISAKEIIGGKIPWLYVDFKKATESDDARKFIYAELLRLLGEDETFHLGDWEKTIKYAYEKQIQVLKKGPLALLHATDKQAFNTEILQLVKKEYQEVVPYVDKVLSYCSTKSPAYVVIDNVDQLESDDYQAKVFVEAQAIARRANVNVILCLRDATYLKHRNSPAFDAFQVDTIYIDPPQIAPVLSRRFAYARDVLASKHAEIVSEHGVKFKVQDLGLFFEIVSSSLLSDKSGFLLEVLSDGDIRRGLTLVREFLASAHASADKALSTYLTDGAFHFPMHEVFKGAILGQKKYYREEESIIPNIFDSKSGSQSTQLLRLSLLNCLTRHAANKTFEGLAIESVMSDLERVGIPGYTTLEIIKAMVGFRIIRTSDGLEPKESSKILATRFGGYIIKELANQFMYLEPCIYDASIFNDEYWDRMKEIVQEINSNHGQSRMANRIALVEAFLEYMEDIERQWVVNSKRYHLENYWDEEVIHKELRPRIMAHIENVKASAKKQR